MQLPDNIDLGFDYEVEDGIAWVRHKDDCVVLGVDAEFDSSSVRFTKAEWEIFLKLAGGNES
jgi:hypothetical protein